MNQIRDILICALVIIAAGIGLGHPETWTWADAGGPYLVNTINFLAEGRPWSCLILMALALTLFMTRIKY